MSNKPLASVSLDADNLWSYLKTHGEEGWESRPTYLDRFSPLVLESLNRLGIQITFFIVGVDAEFAENRVALRSLVEHGHEIGNHSHQHEPWLHLYSRSRLEEEVQRAEDAIGEATGARPVGFRGPGFSWSPVLLQVLASQGYGFDASTFPTYLGPATRAYYFWTAKLSEEEKEERASLFGSFRDGLRPVSPYRWQLPSGGSILEIPVTTIPGIKTPFHLSYLLYLSRFSERLMWTYLWTAVRACRVTGTEPSFLLHPLDLLGADVAPELRFFPGMDLPSEKKVRIFEAVLRELGQHFELVPMSTHAKALEQDPSLPVRDGDVQKSDRHLGKG